MSAHTDLNPDKTRTDKPHPVHQTSWSHRRSRMAADVHEMNQRGKHVGWVVGGVVLFLVGIMLHVIFQIYTGSQAVFKWWKECPNTDKDDCGTANSASAWKIAALFLGGLIVAVGGGGGGADYLGLTTRRKQFTRSRSPCKGEE